MSGLIDFYEIEWDHDFERFGMGFLEAKGLKILRRPGLGSDGGKDMIVSQAGMFGSEFKWLVSCKHRVKSGRSIGVADDQANYNTLYRFGCHGFLFLYSKPPTEDLIRSIERWLLGPVFHIKFCPIRRLKGNWWGILVFMYS